MLLFNRTPLLSEEKLLLDDLADAATQVVLRGLAEQALLDSEERLRAIFDNAGDAIIIYDLDGRIIGANAVTSAASGYSHQELLGLRFSDLAPFSSIRPLLEGKAGGRRRLETVHLTKQGEEVPVEVMVDLIWYAGKDAVLTVCRDVTGRKRMEHELKVSQLKLLAGMEIARIAYWDYDFSTRQFTFDDHFYSLYATSAEKEGGRHMTLERYVEAFILPEDAEQVMRDIARNIDEGSEDKDRLAEHRIRRRDGEVRHFMVRVSVVYDADGRAVRAYGVDQDVTELKQAEAHLRKANETLGMLNRITGHDIRNQLTVLHGNLGMAQELSCEPAMADRPG